jgi:hypothetical protein
LACSPRSGADRKSPARALSVFSLLSAVYLVCVAIGSGLVGPLLWPAAALHAGLAIPLVRSWRPRFKRPEVSAT